EEMSNISKKFRRKMADDFSLGSIPIVDKTSAPDGTVKLLQELHDGHRIESVLLRHDDHNTVCISTQVGCAMACRFCLTARMGLKRNLTPGEIVEQVLNAHSLLPEGENIRNIVYMGMGEPFHNYENTVKSLKIFLNPHGFDYSSRRITVSTSGIVPGIERFAEEEQVKANLAISLNGVTQEARRKLMPVSKRYSLEELIETCRNFPKESRKRITFEYILMKGITDSPESAKRLVSLLHGIKSKVNLIPYNEHPDLEYRSPSWDSIKRFQQYLLDHGLLATLRTSRGQGISAACGQLAVKNQASNPKENHG
ncbi:MAG: 23S rRNA (adenine(2503)-C(2))-methyltransferase RlmN, partial [Proteobacteria bacterium]|nr:23S rRNA (adenine(2503)-C(2))-methyltransferase RlmN [Pseudomonadota bacterium]